MDSHITVRFYRVENRLNDQPNFGNVLTKMLEEPEANLLLNVDDATIQGERLAQSIGRISGDLMRHQYENLPMLVSPGRRAQKLALPDGSGLGHPTAFLFDLGMNILAYQITQDSLALSRFNAFVAKFAGCEPFEMLPVIKASELKQLNAMSPRTLLLKVADPDGLEAVENSQQELRKNLSDLKEFTNGTYVKVQIGIGNAKGQLSRGPLSETVRWLMEQKAKKRGKVQMLKVAGKDFEDGDVRPLNFLSAHIGDSTTLDFKNATPDESYRLRSEYLSSTTALQKDALKKYVKAKG
jgi:hypothetical protein